MKGLIYGILIGVIGSILANYAKPYLDRLLSKLSRRWATRTEKKKHLFETKVREAKDCKEERDRLSFKALQKMMVGIVFLLFSLISLILSYHNPLEDMRWEDTLSLILSFLTLLIGVIVFAGHTKEEAVLTEVFEDTDKANVPLVRESDITQQREESELNESFKIASKAREPE